MRGITLNATPARRGFFVIGALLIGSGAALAQVTSNEDARIDTAPIAKIFPDSQRAAAPAWLKTGLKLTYYCASATIRGSRQMIVPAQKGEPRAWQDGITGQWFKDVEVKNASGESYLEVLVSGIEDGKVQLQTKDLLIVPGALSPNIYGAALTRVGNGMEFWVNADLLNARARNPIETPSLRTLRGDFPLGGKIYDALRIQGKHGADIYDLKSGVLLWESMDAKGAHLKYFIIGEGPREGSRSLGYCRLVTSRVVHFPWTDQRPPDWIGKVRELHFTGEHTDSIPNSFTVPIPESAVFQVRDRGAAWVRTTATLRFGPIANMPPPPPSTTDGISASGGAPGGVFLPPAGLGDLREGQELDSDSITKARIRVAEIRRRGNRETIILSEQGPGYRTDYGYDRSSGMLNSIMIERDVGISTARDTLELVSWR